MVDRKKQRKKQQQQKNKQTNKQNKEKDNWLIIVYFEIIMEYSSYVSSISILAKFIRLANLSSDAIGRLLLENFFTSFALQIIWWFVLFISL